jgi:chromosomal replication initiator protein
VPEIFTPLNPESVIQTSDLNPHWTFVNFIVTHETSNLLAVVRKVADHPGRVYNPYLLYGAPGAGKTHLLQAIVHAVLAKRPATRFALISAERFTSGLLAACKRNTLEPFREFFQNLDLLILDDFSFLVGKETVQSELIVILKLMVTAKRQVLIATSEAASPGKWQRGFLPELKSFLQSGSCLAIVCTEQLSPETITAKAKQLEMELPDEVVACLSSARVNNFRVLEGIILRLHAISNLTGVPISVSLTQDCLRDL